MKPVTHASELLRAACGVVLLATALGACHDVPTVPGPGGVPPELRGLPPGIHPVLTLPAGAPRPQEITRIRLHLYQVGQQDRIASWQGVIHYDPEAVEVVDGAFAEGLMGAWNVVEPGVLRFAGISLEGVGNAAAVELTVKALRHLRASDFRVELEEVVSTAAFTDVTETVSTAPAPLLSGVELSLPRR